MKLQQHRPDGCRQGLHDARNIFVLAGGEYYQFARQTDASQRLIARFNCNDYRTSFEWETGASGPLVLGSAHSHSALGAPESSTLGFAPAIAWLTYGAGHLHGVRIGDIALDIERDALHRETSRRLTPGPASTPSLIEHRQYTALGQLAEQRLEPAVGAVLTEAYRYDKLGRLRARGPDARPS